MAGCAPRAMRTIVAHSEDPDTAEAVAELLARCDAELGGERPAAGLLFAGIDVDHPAALAALAARFPGMPLVGCTTDGELSSVLSFQEDSLALMLFVGDAIAAGAGMAPDLGDPTAVRAALARARAALPGPGAPRLCIALFDSLNVDAAAVVDALNAALPPQTALVGGAAGDQLRTRSTRQLCGREVAQRGAALLLLGGDFEIGVGVSSGWSPLGRVGRVTRAEGARVLEIDGLPAVAFFQRYLGEHVEPNVEFPTLVRARGGSFIRAPLRYDAAAGAIVYAAEVPEGARIQVMTAPTRDILDACRASVATACCGEGGAPFGALAVSCAARKQVLGTRTREECAIVCEVLGPEVPLIGFYSYGEIAPLRDGPRSLYHNQTFVTLVFRQGGARADV